MRFPALIILTLLSLGVWSSCRSSPPSEVPTGDLGPSVTAQASADVIIVERGAPRLTRVQPVPAYLVLGPGETLGLSAIAFDQQGREIGEVTINWQMLDTQAGSITPSGVFRAGFTKGTYNDALAVTARSPAGLGPGSVQATASITIAELTGKLQPTGIRVFPDSAEVDPRETVHLVAMAVDANGVAIPNMKFGWEILEPLAGSIAGDGRLTAGESAGTFPGAVRVTLIAERSDSAGAITTSVDVHVMDPANALRRISATVLPQVISLRPKEKIKFTSMVMDRRGNQMSPSSQEWEILDPRAGLISEAGRLVAGEHPGIYHNSVRVSMVVPDMEDEVVATGTVIIVDVAPPPGPEPREFARVAIFPERVVLSPGESTRVSIVGLSGDVQRMPDANVRWTLVTPEVAEVSQFVTVTAHDFPGIYEPVS